MRRHFAIALATASLCNAAAPAPAALAPRPASTDSLAAVRAVDRRVATIGHRLAIANLELCAQREWRLGIVLIDLSDVAERLRPAVIAAFGQEGGLGVTAVVEGGPADRGGLRADDIILALDGRALPRVEPGANADGSRQAMLAAIPAAFADGEARVEVRRGRERLILEVRAEQGCASIFQAVPRNSRNASADGVTVNVNAGLIDYAQGDGELAAVLAHEFAHNILRHRARLDAAGVRRGFLGIGRQARPIRETEIEADRLSVYLMERAGYDPVAAVRLWTRLGPHPLNFLRSRDHPSWQDRIRLFETEIAAIRAARAAGRTPMPAFVSLPLD